MPQLDKTGPEGVGPTGWRQGGCATTQTPLRRFMGGFRNPRRFMRNRRNMTLREEEAVLTERLKEVRSAIESEEQ
jgi:hypothetical protein